MRKIIPVFVFLFFYLFWYMVYPNHISNQVYFSLFQTDWSYFLSYCSVPGGIAAWCGAFLSQFYRWVWAGALIQVAFTAGLYYFVCYNRVFADRRECVEVWGGIPAILLFFLQTQYSFLAGHSLQIVCWFASLWGIMHITRKHLRLGMAVGSVYPVLLLTGVLPSLLWAVTLLLYECKIKSVYRNGGAILLAWGVCVGVWRRFFPVADGEWFTFFPRVHEFLNYDIVWWLYLWFPATLLLLSGKKAAHRLRWMCSGKRGTVFPGIVILLLFYWGGRQFYYPEVESMLGLQKEAIRGNWECLLQGEGAEKPERLAACVLTNLALAHGNVLAERAMDFPQAGIAGLLPLGDKSYFGTLCCSWVYDWLGVKHEALHWSVETTIAHGDNPPPFLLKQIAVLLMEMGKEPAAARFLKRLVGVPFYGDWAREHLKQVAPVEFQRKIRVSVPFRETGLFPDPDPGRDDFRVGTMGPLYDLIQLAERHPENSQVRDYLLTGLLLEKDIPVFYEWFRNYFPEGYRGPLPRLYRQALILVGYAGLDEEVHKKYPIAAGELQEFRNYMDRCRTFGADKDAAAAALQGECGNTFWYYMHFR